MFVGHASNDHYIDEHIKFDDWRYGIDDDGNQYLIHNNNEIWPANVYMRTKTSASSSKLIADMKDSPNNDSYFLTALADSEKDLAYAIRLGGQVTVIDFSDNLHSVNDKLNITCFKYIESRWNEHEVIYNYLRFKKFDETE